MENILNLRTKIVEKLGEEKLNEYEKYKKDEEKLMMISMCTSIVMGFLSILSFILVMTYENFKISDAIVCSIFTFILGGGILFIFKINMKNILKIKI